MNCLTKMAGKLRKRQSLISLHAYQESARVVMAYCFGYSCRRIVLSELLMTGSRTELDYRNDTFIVNAITNHVKHPELLNGMLDKEHSFSRDFLDRLSIILLAGFVAKKICMQLNCVSVDEEINAADKEDLAGIEYLLSGETNQCNHEFLENVIGQTEGMVRVKPIWNAIDVVAKRMLGQPHGIGRNEIESALQQTSFWQYL